MTGLACDTSVLMPSLVAWHPDHTDSRRAMRDVTVVPAHVLLETYSVLTRLPPRQRITPDDAAAAIAALGLEVVALSAAEHQQLVARLAAAGIGGGAVYDALVGATAREHGRTLVTRDVRARATYDAMGVRFRMD